MNGSVVDGTGAEGWRMEGWTSGQDKELLCVGPPNTGNTASTSGGAMLSALYGIVTLLLLAFVGDWTAVVI